MLVAEGTAGNIIPYFISWIDMVKHYDKCAQSQSEEDTEQWVPWTDVFELHTDAVFNSVATLVSAHLVKPFSLTEADGWSHSNQIKTD